MSTTDTGAGRSPELTALSSHALDRLRTALAASLEDDRASELTRELALAVRPIDPVTSPSRAEPEGQRA